MTLNASFVLMNQKQALERLQQLNGVYARIPRRHMMDIVYAVSKWSVDQYYYFMFYCLEKDRRRISALVKGYLFNKERYGN